MGITTNDLAKLCGVSKTTVIRALNNTGRISDSTKELILKTAEENGYQPDLLARSLAKGRTNTIGVLVLDSKNRYFAQMISAVSEIAQESGYGVSISFHNNDKEKEIEQLKRFAAYKVDGIILSSINEGDEYKRFLNEIGIPIVSVDNMIAKEIPFVDISQRKAMKAATEKVLSRGYNKVYFICPPIGGDINKNTYVHKKRLEGFNQAVESYSSEIDVKYLLDWNYLEKLDKENIDDTTAFICTSDEVALDIMLFLKNKGLIAGKDYGLHGFDNIDTLKYLSPRLDTIDNNVEMVAQSAIKLLLDLIDGKETNQERRIIIPFDIIDGATLK